MSSDPQELGKGLFGYRKSAVNQIIADRDIMLRQAEGRVRAAESKVHELEGELVSMRERNTRMDEQLERLRQQLDVLVGRGQADASPAAPADAPAGAPPMEQSQPEAEPWEEEPAATAEPPSPMYGEEEPAEAEEAWPAADHEWLATDEAAPVVEAAVSDHAAGAIEEDELAYGAEVQMGEDEDSETSASTWMHPGPAVEEGPEEHDEVAMAADGYGFEDYDAEEQQAYAEFGSSPEEEEEEEESPSPFTRFPFTPETFDQEPAEVAHGAQGEHHADEPVSPADTAPPEALQPEPVSQVQPPDHAAASVPPTSAVSQETTDITNRFLTEELAGVLAAAEESAARIVERARTTTQGQIARSNRVWREVQAEVSRFASWRQEVEPVIHSVQAKVDGVRSEIEEVPERIRQALAPMADAISSIDADLAELAAASNPPLLLTPTGLETAGSDSEAWDLDADADDGFAHGDASGFGQASDEGSGHLHAG
jgi:peptidoglycan hydrolase CwlO-like protein